VPRPAWLIRPDGPVPYDVANEAMHDLARRRLDDEIPDTVILLEHPPVFTAGRRAADEDLLWSPDEVEARGGSVRRIDRGGSFTFHGPGQLVGYPILHLGARPDAGGYLRGIEDTVIAVCRDHGATTGRRVDVQTGVWAGDDKVCAIGVRLMRTRVTLHGFALNVDPDLSWFDGIVACGLPDHGVTSLRRLLDREITVPDVLPSAVRRLATTFDLGFEDAPPEIAAAFPPTRDVA
jgi:lipoyl(octanoyl) transferase